MRDALGRKRRLDYELIESMIPNRAHVLDLGCGHGALLADLMARKGCTGRGIEIAEELVGEAIERGVPVYHGDMLEGMGHFNDLAFDVVILSQTLQQTTDPVAVMREMLRVGRTAIISFPNFAHWRIRLQLLVDGRMPVTGRLPYAWFDTPNVHLCTVNDFRALCVAERLRVISETFLAGEEHHVPHWAANWLAELGIFQVTRSSR